MPHVLCVCTGFPYIMGSKYSSIVIPVNVCGETAYISHIMKCFENLNMPVVVCEGLGINS